MFSTPSEASPREIRHWRRTLGQRMQAELTEPLEAQLGALSRHFSSIIIKGDNAC